MSENLIAPQDDQISSPQGEQEQSDLTFWDVVKNLDFPGADDISNSDGASLEQEIFGDTEAPPEVETMLRSVALRFGAESSKWLFNKETWFLDDKSMREMLERGERTRVESLASAIVAYYVSFD